MFFMLKKLPSLRYFLYDDDGPGYQESSISYARSEYNKALPLAVKYMDNIGGKFETKENIGIYKKNINTGNLFSVYNLYLSINAEQDSFPNIEIVNNYIIIDVNAKIRHLNNITHCNQILCNNVVLLDITDNWSEINSNYPFKYEINGKIVNCKKAIM